MKLALSTSWFKVNEFSPKELVKTLQELGIDAVEADYRLKKEYLEELKNCLRKENIEVISAHNFLPWPDISPSPGGDVFSLASLDKEEWRVAVRYTIKTMQEALDLGCRAVVLHLGKVSFKEGKEFYKNLPRVPTNNGYPLIPQLLLSKREELAPQFLDRAMLALDKLLLAAERYELFLGIENRYHFYEIPSFSEVKLLLSEFKGSNLYYWHDVGHAEINARLGLVQSEEYLSEFNERLLGFHLHDVRGLEDHFAPFSGEVDWQGVASYFSPKTLMVIEAHSKASEEELKKGIGLLKSLSQKAGKKCK